MKFREPAKIICFITTLKNSRTVITYPTQRSNTR